MINAFVMTVKGQSDLTWQCLKTFNETVAPLKDPALMIVVDASEDASAISYREISSWLWDRTDFEIVYTRWINCTLTKGWNYAINSIKDIVPSDTVLNDINVHLMQNDLIFLKEGWFPKLEAALLEPDVGAVGTTGMRVFGHEFVTGAVQSFNLFSGMVISPNGKIIDERFNHAYPDVDLCVRFSKDGFRNIKVDGMEYGENPYMKHLISQTMYSELGVDKTMALRAEEEKIFLEKWGKVE